MERHGHVKDSDLLGVLYIGLGDQFDDDRRVVREAASALRRVHPTDQHLPGRAIWFALNYTAPTHP